MKVAEDETSAQFHMATILEATPGTLISGDEIADIIRRASLLECLWQYYFAV